MEPVTVSLGREEYPENGEDLDRRNLSSGLLPRRLVCYQNSIFVTGGLVRRIPRGCFPIACLEVQPSLLVLCVSCV